MLQSAPVILQPTQTAKGSQQPIRCAGGGFLPAIPAKGIYYDNPSRGQGRREVREPNRVRISGMGGGEEGPKHLDVEQLFPVLVLVRAGEATGVSVKVIF